MTQAEFSNIYWAAQPPAVAALNAMATRDERMNAAVPLVLAKTTPIDQAIMIDGTDPYNTMLVRQSYGFTWVPALGQPNIAMMPGCEAPGSGWEPYDPSNPPKGSIKVSVDPADYPAFTKPPEPEQHPSVPAKPGACTGGNYYAVRQGDASPNGTVYQDSTGKYLKHVDANGPWVSMWWTKEA